MRVSVIVPVLNEAPSIRPFLRHLRGRAPGAEVIVVDGGSDDGTPARAAGLCDRLLEGPRGRAAQMNLGARHAGGDALWFLHADCEVPPDGLAALAGALDDAGVAGGCFRVRLPRREWIYRVHDGLAHPVGRWLRIRCGDHGIFARRAAFDAAGGYPLVPLMEDVELFRALHAHGRLAWLDTRLRISARRHEQVGVYRYTVVCALIVALYCAGARPPALARLYARLVPPREGRRGGLPPVEDALFPGFREPEPAGP